MADSFVDSFFSELQKSHLKRLGYKKERRNFFRELPKYIERIQFQGSQWNSAEEPWRFYINMGVQFRDLPRREPDRDFPNTHVHVRLERLVKTNGDFFEITEKNRTDMLEKIAGLLVEASAALKKLALAQYPKCQERSHIWKTI